MNIVIITNSTSYEPRAEKAGAFFQRLGHRVLWLESDFFHREKKKGREAKPDHIYIDTAPYKRNLSVSRLYSQYDFARKAGRVLEEQQADLLYVMLPANSLAPVAAGIKEKYHVKLVFDVIDLWPESLPMKRIKGLWPVQCWRRLRDDHLAAADLVLTECRMYQDVLPAGKHDGENRGVMYWPKDKRAEKLEFIEDPECLHIVYLGSINHIIDMEMIAGLLEKIQRHEKLKLHIVGDGENREAFLKLLKEKKIETEYYGAVYEEEKKREIFRRCSFGINIMKPDVCVGLTMKSIDYFCYGLPVINNIKGDTWQLVEEYGIGVNCQREDPGSAAKAVLKLAREMREKGPGQIPGQECAQKQEQDKREKVRELYNRLFTVEAMERVLAEKVLPLIEER